MSLVVGFYVIPGSRWLCFKPANVPALPHLSMPITPVLFLSHLNSDSALKAFPTSWVWASCSLPGRHSGLDPSSQALVEGCKGRYALEVHLLRHK